MRKRSARPLLPLGASLLSLSSAALVLASTGVAAADPPAPSGPHPRLFMSPANVAAYATRATTAGTAAASMVAACQDTIGNPSQYATRGGSDGDYWPGSAVACAFAYQATQKAEYLAQALTYWKASLDDDQSLGDKLGCVDGVDTSWQSWDGSPPAPPVIRTVTHDTGYPIRWFGPDIALTYDWLYGAPGVTPALQAQTRTCLGNWIDYYTKQGYHRDEAGSNYNAGYVAAITFGAAAIGNDGGADGHLWTQALDDVFQKLLIGNGLAGANSGLGSPAGVMLGGDWGEGWQYGPLAVIEYAASARALTDNGASLPEMDAWVNSLVVRYAHGTVPHMDAQYVGGGDFDSTDVYPGPNANQLDAVLLGSSTDTAAGWAAYMKQKQLPNASGSFIWNALAEIRAAQPADYRAQTPAPPLWYLARGTRSVYARTAWDENAFWGVFASSPQVNSDHHHFAASNLVFSRGGDHLIIDASNYGEPDTLASNAVSADSPGVQNDYAKSQTPWSLAELLWARGTTDAVYGARSDFAQAFIFSSTASDIPYAHREWTMLPEGEIVTIDRVHTADVAHFMYVGFHANTGGTLKLAGSVATGTVGSSALAIHAVTLSGATPAIAEPLVGDCTLSCSYPCGACDAARFPVDEYTVKVPGPWAVAIHVIDGLGPNEPPAVVGSLNDDTYDPAPKQNGDVIGAAVNRAMKQSYVLGSSAMDGASPATMTYGVPGTSASRHIVYDAPEAADGSSSVTATPLANRCVITIAKGSGAGFAGHPLMFQVSAAGDGCKASDDTNVSPGMPPQGTGGGSSSSSSGGSSSGAGGDATKNGGAPGADTSGASGGCGCFAAGDGAPVRGAALLALVGLALARRLRRRPPRSS